MLKEETLEFFRELRSNNTKEWFEQNRKKYFLVRDDYLNLAGRLLSGLQSFVPHLGHLNPQDCVFRINRDLRFSSDKTPYKTHLGLIFTPYGRKVDYACYYLHIDEEDQSFAGGGLHMPSADKLKKTRNEIMSYYNDFLAVIQSVDFKQTFNEMDLDQDIMLKRPPKDVDPKHPGILYLKLKSFTATKAIPADWLRDPEGVGRVLDIFQALRPLNDFINRALL